MIKNIRESFSHIVGLMIKKEQDLTDFRSLKMKNTFKEMVKRSRSLQKADAYLEPEPTSTLEAFCEYT